MLFFITNFSNNLNAQPPECPCYFSCEAEIVYQNFSPNEYDFGLIGNCENIIKYYWDFGDGTTSDEEFPTHTFNINLPVTITLIAINEDGCCVTFSIIINLGTTSSGSCDGLCSGFTVDQSFEEFTNSSCYNQTNWHIQDGCIADWFPANGTPDVFQETTNHPAIDGDYYGNFVEHEAVYTPFKFYPYRNYSISLAGRLDLGGTLDVFGNLELYMANNMIPNSTNQDLPLYENNLNTIWPLIGILESENNAWIENCFEFNLDHLSNTYEYFLIQSRFGEGASVLKKMYFDKVRITCELDVLNSIEYRNFGGGEIGFGAIYNYQDVQGNLSYLWDFDDETTSSQTNPTHTFTTSGTYNVCVTITDEEGCCESVCEEVVVDCDCGACSEDLSQYDHNNDNIVTSYEIPNSVTLSGRSFYLEPFLTLELNNTSYIDNCVFYCDEGSVINLSTAYIEASNNDFFACEKMWKGIVLKSGKFVNFWGNKIYDAEFGLNLENNSNIIAYSNTFDRNYIGVSSPPSVTVKNIVNNFAGNKFICSGTLKPKYTGQTTPTSSITHAGIQWSNVAQLNLTGLFSFEGNNVFDGIKNGVLLLRTSLVSIKNTYKNLIGSNNGVSYSYLSGIGIRAEYPKTLRIANDSFIDCHTGVSPKYIQNSNVSIKTNYFEAMRDIGINGYLFMNSNTLIDADNHFLECKKGIKFNVIKGGAAFHIDDNDFYNGQYFSGGYSINLNNGDATRISTINENLIETYNDGIIFTNANNYDINANVIDISGGNVVNGISVNDITGTRMKDNTVSFPLSTSTDQYGIKGSLANDTWYCCNTINGGNSGTYFEGINNRIQLINSTYNNITSGITLFEAKIDDQPIQLNSSSENLHGNRWYGTPNVASIESPSGNANNIATLSEIYYNTSESNTKPTTVIPSTIESSWFPQNTKNSKFCNVDPDCSEHEDKQIPIIGDTLDVDTTGFDDQDWDDLCEDYWQYFIDIAEGNTLGGYYANQNQWISQYWLFSKLKESEASYWMNCDALNSFYTANYSEMHPFYEVDKGFSEMYSYTQQEQDDIDDIKDDIATVSASISNEIYANSITPSNSSTLSAYNTLLISYIDDIYEIEGDADTRHLDELDDLEDKIDLLDPELATLVSLKTMYKYTVEYFKYGESGLSSTELDEVRDMAQACPLEYGKAVYAAASLLSILGEEVRISAKDNCDVPEPRISKVNHLVSTDINIYPNPSFGNVTIKLPYEVKDGFTITISDAIGKEVLRYENVNQPLFKVDMTDIEKGLYIINVKTKDIDVLSEKIILIE